MLPQDISRVDFNEVDEVTNLSDADLAVIALTDDEIEDLAIMGIEDHSWFGR